MVEKTYKSDDGSHPADNRAFEGICQKEVDAFLRLQEEFAATPEIPWGHTGSHNANVEGCVATSPLLFRPSRQTSGNLPPIIVRLDIHAASHEGLSTPQRSNQPSPPPMPSRRGTCYPKGIRKNYGYSLTTCADSPMMNHLAVEE